MYLFLAYSYPHSFNFLPLPSSSSQNGLLPEPLGVIRHTLNHTVDLGSFGVGKKVLYAVCSVLCAVCAVCSVLC